ncbi:C1-like protein [Artemisia annua]|uniref:C1-like protein n=1 Tax=Artemisia annua TaxID=35608 RepID=A0A2U1Q5R9_ARTAN|nr:C1-like protein [Artemisia annua]
MSFSKDGFAYNCNDCDINIHVGCATLPLYISHGSHAHQLKLEFSPPYGSNAFSCDICGVIGASNCWLYRCVPCGYDAHVSCATSKRQVVAERSRSVVPDQNLYLNQFNNANNQYLQAVMGNVGAASSNMTNQLLQQMIGGGGNPLMQMIGGGGGGDPLLQLMGGGGGGNPLLQMMGGDMGQGLGELDFSSALGGIGDIGGLGGFGF